MGEKRRRERAGITKGFAPTSKPNEIPSKTIWPSRLTGSAHKGTCSVCMTENLLTRSGLCFVCFRAEMEEILEQQKAARDGETAEIAEIPTITEETVDGKD